MILCHQRFITSLHHSSPIIHPMSLHWHSSNEVLFWIHSHRLPRNYTSSISLVETKLRMRAYIPSCLMESSHGSMRLLALEAVAEMEGIPRWVSTSYIS